MTIKDMLKAGKTPEELMKEINDAQRELTREKDKEKAVAAARQKVVDAMKEYSKLLYGREPDIRLMDNFNKDLKDVENAGKLVGISDDDRIRRFLRGLMIEY